MLPEGVKLPWNLEVVEQGAQSSVGLDKRRDILGTGVEPLDIRRRWMSLRSFKVAFEKE